MALRVLIVSYVLLSPFARQHAQASSSCDEPIEAWRKERDPGRKSQIFERLPDPCKELLYAAPSPAAGNETASETLVETEADGAHPFDAIFVRGDLGLNAPTGLLAIAVGAQFLGPNAVELGVGSGSASNFFSATYRRTSGSDGWRLAGGLGASVGFSSNSGYDVEQHTEDPTTTTTWVHGEIAAQRMGKGFVMLAAVGLEGLMSGTYHVDGGDIQLVDREPFSVQPYFRLGLGAGF